jgi:hypothetical protein
MQFLDLSQEDAEWARTKNDASILLNE